MLLNRFIDLYLDEVHLIASLITQMDIENAVLRFFNLNSERRQQICDNLEDPTLDAFALMLKAVEECEQAGCTEQETDELLMLINDSRNVMEEYYFKDFERALLNIGNLRLYIEQKNKLLNKRNPLYVTSFLSMGSAANSPLWLSVQIKRRLYSRTSHTAFTRCSVIFTV